MSLRRSSLYPVLLAAAAAIFYVALPVEARNNPTPAARASASAASARRIFAAESFPDREEFLARAAAAGQKPAPAAAALPEGKGKDLAIKNCGTCHAINVWTVQHHTREQWGSIIDNMVSKGLSASDDDLDTITDYLATNFGPAVKTPPAAEPAPPSSSSPTAPPSAR